MNNQSAHEPKAKVMSVVDVAEHADQVEEVLSEQYQVKQGQLDALYSGRGRPPTRQQAQPGWQYLQLVKQRDEHGHFQGSNSA